MAKGRPSTPRGRRKRVTVQHTQERVRNNQRRHRARRKDYIATLENKLSEAEQTISSLKDQVEALQAASARWRRETHDFNGADCQPRGVQCQNDTSLSSPARTDDIAVQSFGMLPGAGEMTAWELAAPTSISPLLFGGQLGSEVNTLIPEPNGIPTAHSSEAISEVPLTTGLASFEAESLLHPTFMQSAKLPPTTPCCRDYSLLDSQQTTDAAHFMAAAPSPENSLPMPGYVLDSGTGDCYQAQSYEESTMPCSEAYVLIAQQNVKGASQELVTAWLWSGFRRPPQPGAGCRVQTDMVFGLLAFISNSSKGQE